MKPTLGDKLHLGWAERIVFRNNNVHFKDTTRIRSIVGTLQCLNKVIERMTKSIVGLRSDKSNTVLHKLHAELHVLTPVKCLGL